MLCSRVEEVFARTSGSTTLRMFSSTILRITPSTFSVKVLDTRRRMASCLAPLAAFMTRLSSSNRLYMTSNSREKPFVISLDTSCSIFFSSNSAGTTAGAGAVADCCIYLPMSCLAHSGTSASEALADDGAAAGADVAAAEVCTGVGSGAGDFAWAGACAICAYDDAGARAEVVA